jgi:hypothetical protein
MSAIHLHCGIPSFAILISAILMPIVDVQNAFTAQIKTPSKTIMHCGMWTTIIRLHSLLISGIELWISIIHMVAVAARGEKGNR